MAELAALVAVGVGTGSAAAAGAAGTGAAVAATTGISAATWGTAALIGGMGLTAAGQYQQGQAAAAQAKGQQAMAEYNAKVQEREAQAAEQATLYKQKRMAEAAARNQSSLLAAFGASGVVPTEGSPLLIAGEQAKQSEMDMLLAGYEGQVAQMRARSQGAIDRMQAGIYGQAAGNASRGGLMGAGATLLTGFGTAKVRGFFG